MEKLNKSKKTKQIDITSVKKIINSELDDQMTTEKEGDRKEIIW